MSELLEISHTAVTQFQAPLLDIQIVGLLLWYHCICKWTKVGLSCWGKHYEEEEFLQDPFSNYIWLKMWNYLLTSKPILAHQEQNQPFTMASPGTCYVTDATPHKIVTGLYPTLEFVMQLKYINLSIYITKLIIISFSRP